MSPTQIYVPTFVLACPPRIALSARRPGSRRARASSGAAGSTLALLRSSCHLLRLEYFTCALPRRRSRSLRKPKRADALAAGLGSRTLVHNTFRVSRARKAVPKLLRDAHVMRQRLAGCAAKRTLTARLGKQNCKHCATVSSSEFTHANCEHDNC